MPLSSPINWPDDVAPPSKGDLCTLSATRKIDILAFYTAGLLGTLRTATHHGHRAWLITDLEGLCAEARRLDGQMWDGGQKSLALPGSRKNRPVGLKTHNSRLDALKNIVLVEGAPDYYAALALAIDSPANFRVAAMLGSGCNISECDVADCRILIIPHGDLAGLSACDRWSKELYALGAKKVRYQRLPEDCKDLNIFLEKYPEPEHGEKLLKWLNQPSPQESMEKENHS